MTDSDFKYLTQEFGPKNLELLKQKDAYPYDYIDSFERFIEDGATGDIGDKIRRSHKRWRLFDMQKNSEQI